MKKIVITSWIIIMLVLVYLTINYASNEKLVSNYGKGKYEENDLSGINFTQEYITHFNRGDIYYQNGDYESAKAEYKKALNLSHPESKDCLIRINLALSMVVPIDADQITKNNIDKTIELLEDAKKILMEHGCATDDNDGHNQDAQTLKNEIDDFEDELKSKTETETETNDSGEDETETEENESENKELEQQFKDLQKQSTQERNASLEDIKNIGDYSYYNGKKW